MSLIAILPQELCNKIAAGEVIERPASVVKELIENALDAGSSEIRTEVSHGGKRLIRVSDNGPGMDRDDAVLSIRQHATSKIREFDDLFAIRTLGFRGEALASIASVSKMSIVTGLQGAAAGTRIEVHGGEVQETRDAPASGTSVEVRDLFYNTPARRKFLKTDSTELFHIIDAVTKAALSRPDTAFSLVVDRTETISLPRASGLKERIQQVYGEEFLAGLVGMDAAMDGLELQAFVSNSTSFRGTRSHQFIFLNRRPIRDQSIAHAVYRAYEGIIPPDRHPIFFIFLQIDPQKVDCNVHPTKREVRFEDKETIYQFMVGRLREAVREERGGYLDAFSGSPRGMEMPAAAGTPGEGYGQPSAPWAAMISENLEFSYRPTQPHIYLGGTFFAVAGKGGLTIVDHHAAHERVLYERLLRGMESVPRPLLIPRQVTVTAKEHHLLLDNRDLLMTFGLEIDDFGRQTLVVRALPQEVPDIDLPGILSDIAAGLADRQASAKPLRNELAARIACHSSVRGRAVLSAEEVARLLEDLEQTDQPDQCPHGRPTRIFFTLDDLNRLFRRT